MQEISKQGGPSASVRQLQGNEFAHSRVQVVQAGNIRDVPTYLDEFKYGFPSNGLSSVSNNWWKGCNSFGDGDSAMDRTVGDLHPPDKSPGIEESEDLTNSREGAARLIILREKSANESREALKGMAKLYKSQILTGNEKMLLSRIFG